MDEEINYDMPTVVWLLEPVYSVLVGMERDVSEDEIRDAITDTFEIPIEVASKPQYIHRVYLALQYLLAAGLIEPGQTPGQWKCVEFDEAKEVFFDINEISRKYHEKESAQTGNIIPFRR